MLPVVRGFLHLPRALLVTLGDECSIFGSDRCDLACLRPATEDHSVKFSGQVFDPITSAVVFLHRSEEV